MHSHYTTKPNALMSSQSAAPTRVDPSPFVCVGGSPTALLYHSSAHAGADQARLLAAPDEFPHPLAVVQVRVEGPQFLYVLQEE